MLLKLYFFMLICILTFQSMAILLLFQIGHLHATRLIRQLGPRNEPATVQIHLLLMGDYIALDYLKKFHHWNVRRVKDNSINFVNTQY